MSKDLIIVENLSFGYDSELILKDLNFRINEGEVTVIIGPRGEGKTTLLKLLAGLIPFQNGEIYYRNIRLKKILKKDLIKIQRKTAFVFQNSALISNMSIFDNIALPLRYNEILSEREIEKKVLDLLNYIDLLEVKDMLPAYISTGQRKLAAFMRALSMEPETIFADEPIANLDITSQDKIINIIREQKEKGYTFIIITHELQQFKDIISNVIILKDRSIYKIGTYNDIKETNDEFIQRIILA